VVGWQTFYKRVVGRAEVLDKETSSLIVMSALPYAWNPEATFLCEKNSRACTWAKMYAFDFCRDSVSAYVKIDLECLVVRTELEDWWEAYTQIPRRASMKELVCAGLEWVCHSAPALNGRCCHDGEHLLESESPMAQPER
jgi:hypothetical protein